MAEYIERIDAIKAVNKQNAFTMTRVALIDSLNSIPAADVATVVHGRWVFETATANTLSRIKCDICGWWTLDPSVDNSYKYCPNCGAKMDGGDNDAAD